MRRGSGRELAVLFAILAVAAVARFEVIRAIPSFFGPGDPSIYYQMGRATLAHGVPRVPFLHHLHALPDSIRHVENYYEPAFAYPLALAMAVGGRTPQGAAGLSLACGLIAILLAWRWARNHGAVVALLAAAIVAFEPWSLYYGGVLMKEALVGVVVLAFVEALRRAIPSERGSPVVGAAIGLTTVVASLFQYELLPILGLTALVALAAHRRGALPAFLLAAAVGAGLMLAVTWFAQGVPISAKLFYALGHASGDLEVIAAERSPLGLETLEYLGSGLLLRWYPILLLLAAVGMTSGEVAPAERTVGITLFATYVFLHAVPVDLWSRDFIPLTVVLARPVALAIGRREGWRTRAWIAPATIAAAFFVFAVPLVHSLLAGRVSAIQNLGLWTIVGAGAAVSLAIFSVLRALLPAGRWMQAGRVMPFVGAAALLASFWILLPYPEIYKNPQFPIYEIERARRERVSRWMSESVPPGLVIATHPAEVATFSGFPVVVMPESLRVGTTRLLATKYAARYLLLDLETTGDEQLPQLGVTKVGEREGYRLYSFR